MWNELEQYKNQFLQLRLPHIRAETINQLTKEEITRQQCKRRTCPPDCPPRIEHPHSTYLDDHAKLAYGRLALPKLMREMCSDNILTHWRAINSLSEFLMNPLNAERAINEMDIVRREKDEEISPKILRNLTEKVPVLLYMRDHTVALDNLTKIFHLDMCRPIYPVPLWFHLSHFLEIAPELAIEKGFFELFHSRIVNRLPLYHHLNMKCFAMLLQCDEGQRRFDKVDGVAMIYEVFMEKPTLDTYEYVVLAFQNAIVSKRTLWRCCQFMSLTEVLVRIANQQVQAEEQLIPYVKSRCENWRKRVLQEDEFSKVGEMNVHLQLYCLKALRQMGQMPCIKRYIHDVCLENIRKMKCLNLLNECERDDLVQWLEHEIYESDYSPLEKF